MNGKQVDIVAALEQVDTHMVNVARIMANYRQELIENGIPEALADDMVLDLQARLLSTRGMK